MATRIRRAGAAVALTLLMATALAGVAWAANTIQCEPGSDALRPCAGTGKNDVMYGTNKADVIGGGYHGADTLYGRGGDDELIGGVGPDKVYGGPGDDDITNQETDYPFGRDANHGGPGNDSIFGNISPEKHYGGEAMTTSLSTSCTRTRTCFAVGRGAMKSTITRASIR